MKSRINKKNGIYLSFPKIKKSGNKVVFPVMFMKFSELDDSRITSDIDLPKNIRMDRNRWKHGTFSSADYLRNQEICSYVYSVMQSVTDNVMWVENEGDSCPNFCAINFKNRTAIHVFNDWNNYRIIKSDDDEKFNILLKKFCIQYVKMKDPIEDLYVKSKLKDSQPNKSFFTTIFTVDLSEWLGEWCGGITEAYCSAVFTA